MNDATLTAAARRGFQTIGLDEELKQSADAHLRDWLRSDKFAGLAAPGGYRPLLEWMVDSRNFDLLLDSFYRVIPFGTGGRRGPVGIGPNRINPYTIASSIQGHVEYLRKKLPGERRLIAVVAYDVREFNNLRGVYPAGVPNPLLGLSSKDLAHIAACVYCAAGVAVFMLPDEPADYISTPELSYLIRRFGAHGGINVSASHNHPDDNGGKFYNQDGGQEIPPHDEELVRICCISSLFFLPLFPLSFPSLPLSLSVHILSHAPLSPPMLSPLSLSHSLSLFTECSHHPLLFPLFLFSLPSIFLFPSGFLFLFPLSRPTLKTIHETYKC